MPSWRSTAGSRRGSNHDLRFLEAIRQRPHERLEFLLASLRIAWRGVAPTRHPACLDLLFYSALNWILLLFVSPDDHIESLTAFLMTLLPGIHLHGQMAHMLAVLDLLP